MQDGDQYPNVGIAEIDTEHAALAEDLSQLIEAVRDDDVPRCATLARILVEGAREHFAHEERLMAEIDFPFFDRHKATHDRFLADAATCLGDLRSAGLNARCLRWVTSTMDWFRTHVRTEDMALGQALVSTRAKSLSKFRR